LYSLINPKRVKAATRVVDDVMSAKGVEIIDINGETNYITPSVSNRLVAAAMVLDRADPIHRIHEHVIAEDYSPLEMSEYILPSRVIDHVEDAPGSTQTAEPIPRYTPASDSPDDGPL